MAPTAEDDTSTTRAAQGCDQLGLQNVAVTRGESGPPNVSMTSGRERIRHGSEQVLPLPASSRPSRSAASSGATGFAEAGQRRVDRRRRNQSPDRFRVRRSGFDRLPVGELIAECRQPLARKRSSCPRRYRCRRR